MILLSPDVFVFAPSGGQLETGDVQITAIDTNNVREKLDDSRRRAAQYLKKAAHSNDAAAKAEALDLAETWRDIAERTEKLLNQLENASEPILPDALHVRNNDAALNESAMASS